MNNGPEQDKMNRIRQARQVIAGSDVRPPSTYASSYASNAGLITSSQRTYLITVGALLVLSVLLWLIFSMGVASVIFFILSLLLIAGWLVF
jgi:Flp pilus assembly protein TadB